MDVQTTNLQQLCDAIMTIWTKISEECFQHLVESMPWRIKTVLKAKVGQTWYWQVVPNKVPVSVYYIISLSIFESNKVSFLFLNAGYFEHIFWAINVKWLINLELQEMTSWQHRLTDDIKSACTVWIFSNVMLKSASPFHTFWISIKGERCFFSYDVVQLAKLSGSC